MRSISYKWLSFAIVATGTTISTMDSSIILISLPSLTQIFQTTPSVIVWLVLIYNLVLTATVLTMGRIADTLGRKRVYAVGFLIFTVGMALSSVAQNVYHLIGSRGFQAIGAAMMVSAGSAIITATFPEGEKGKALGISEAAAGVGLMCGPALGGLILDAFGWRAMFFLRLPIAIAGSIAAWKLLRDDPVASGQPRQGFDYLGAGLLSGGLASLLLAVNQQQARGWTSVFVLSFLAAAVLFLSAFVLIEKRLNHPVVDLSLFQSRSFATGNTMLFLYHLGSSILLFMMPFFLISAVGYSSSHAGLIVMILPMMLLLVAPMAGWLSDRLDPRLLTAVGLSLQCLGLLAISRLPADAGLLDVVPRLALAGVGTGLFTSPVYNSIMGAVPRQRLGTASAMIPTMRNIGIACGMAVGGAIFVSRKAYHLAYLPTVVSPEATEKLSVVGGFQDTLLAAAAIAFAGAMVAIFGARGKSRRRRVG